MRKALTFIVFASASCIVAAASALWERGRRFMRGLNRARPAIGRRFGGI